MSNSRGLSRFTLMVLSVLLISLSGCTIVGNQIGNSIDHKSEDYWNLSPETLQEIPEGAQLDIRMRDGGKLSGTKLFFANADSALVIQKTEHIENSLFEDFHSDFADGKQSPELQYRLPMAEIGMITVNENNGKGRTIGTIVGAAVDVTLVTIYAVSVNSFSMGP